MLFASVKNAKSETKKSFAPVSENPGADFLVKIGWGGVIGVASNDDGARNAAPAKVRRSSMTITLERVASGRSIMKKRSKKAMTSKAARQKLIRAAKRAVPSRRMVKVYFFDGSVRSIEHITGATAGYVKDKMRAQYGCRDDGDEMSVYTVAVHGGLNIVKELSNDDVLAVRL